MEAPVTPTHGRPNKSILKKTPSTSTYGKLTSACIFSKMKHLKVSIKLLLLFTVHECFKLTFTSRFLYKNIFQTSTNGFVAQDDPSCFEWVTLDCLCGHHG